MDTSGRPIQARLISCKEHKCIEYRGLVYSESIQPVKFTFAYYICIRVRVVCG